MKIEANETDEKKRTYPFLVRGTSTGDFYMVNKRNEVINLLNGVVQTCKYPQFFYETLPPGTTVTLTQE